MSCRARCRDVRVIVPRAASDFVSTCNRAVVARDPKHGRHRAVKRREFITLLGGVAAAARVHATLACIVARRDRVLIFASPMSEPNINSVIERESVCHLEQTRSSDHYPCHQSGEAREQQQIMHDEGHRKSPLRSAEQSLRAVSSPRRRDRRRAASRSGY
jgi:hypothetical protein